MDSNPQGNHEIRLFEPETEEAKARYVPLTEEQARELEGASKEERHAWLKANLPTRERLSRHLRWVGLPVLAARAAQCEFSDFDGPHAMPKVVLLSELDKALHKVVRKKGEHSDKAFHIRDLRKLIVAGEYDDTKAESDTWAARQKGETGELLDRLGMRGPSDA